MKDNLYIIFGFISFGLLIGFIAGVSSAAITQPLMAALFAFIGGKIFLEFETKGSSYRRTAGGILIGFSIFCLFGIIAGIFIKTNETFGKKIVRGKTDSTNISSDYLKSSKEFGDNIFSQFRASKSKNVDSLLEELENKYEQHKLIIYK